MCALLGWLDYGKKLPHKTLRKLHRNLQTQLRSVVLMQAEFHIF